MTLFAKLNHFIPLYIFNCKLFIYSLSEQNTIVNYDSETDKFSTFFDNFKKELKPKFNKDTLNFAKEFNKLGDNAKSQNLDILISQFKEVDSSVIDMAKSVQNGSMEMDDFKAKTLDATTASSKFSRMAKTAGTALKSIGATALNMFGGVVIAEVLSMAIKGIYDFIHAEEIAIEKGHEAQDKIQESFTSYNQKVDSIKSLGQKFGDDTAAIKTTSDAIESTCYRTSERTIIPLTRVHYLISICKYLITALILL